MDRVTVYAGQIPLETDLLSQSRNAMVGLAKFAAGVLGSTTIVNGFTCTPTGPASLNVIVTAGEVYQLENLEQSTWSSLSTDTHTILKQGIVLDPTTFGITPPGTVGFSQNFLIEAQYQDTDAGSTVLPYFNAGNPAVPFSGPVNAGTAQNTVRKGVAALQVKAGIAAATGSQTTPTADAGWAGMFVVTVANGASTITSGNITTLATAPFIPCTLPNVPVTSQSGVWETAQDTGGVNALVATLNPIPASYNFGMEVKIKVAVRNTGAATVNLNTLGAKSIVRFDGTALQAGDLPVGMVARLVYDGTNFQLQNPSTAVSRLTSNPTLFVRTDGNDTNDGSANTSAKAFLTIQGALNFALTTFTLGGKTLIIQLGIAGTYAAFTVPSAIGSIQVIGNVGSASSYIISGAGTGSGQVVIGAGGAPLSLDGVTIQNTGTVNHTVGAVNGGSLTLGTVILTASAPLNSTSSHVFAGTGGTVAMGTALTINQSAGSVFWVSTGSMQVFGTVTIASAAAFSAAVAVASACGTIQMVNTFSGTPSGKRFDASLNGIINAFGAGASFIPGTVAGTTATGGQYA